MRVMLDLLGSKSLAPFGFSHQIGCLFAVKQFNYSERLLPAETPFRKPKVNVAAQTSSFLIDVSQIISFVNWVKFLESINIGFSIISINSAAAWFKA